MEKINILAKTISGHFVAEAIGQLPDEGMSLISANNPLLDVEVKINGVVVPFENTMEIIYKQLQKVIEEEEQSKIRDKTNRYRFEKLAQMIDKFEWEIEQELDRLFKE
jgi:hypothetical protein